MNKAFVKESSEESDDDLDAAQPAIPAGAKNYITPAGYRRLRDELLHGYPDIGELPGRNSVRLFGVAVVEQIHVEEHGMVGVNLRGGHF